jgi:DTW domain-containing protein YfiP
MALTLRDYQNTKKQRLLAEIPPRDLCYVCWRPQGFCYCAKIRPTETELKFAILIHPIEEKRPIATGRMSHLCLKDSLLIEGDDYTEEPAVNDLLEDPAYHPVVLYPGEGSSDLSALSPPERRALFPEGKRPLVFVIDGTWNSARRTLNRSLNLQGLPQIRFTPPAPSRIRVRHQPEKHYFTTIEAIHHVIDLLALPDASARPHDNLLEVLDYMVNLQLPFFWQGKRRDEGPRKRRHPF